MDLIRMANKFKINWLDSLLYTLKRIILQYQTSKLKVMKASYEITNQELFAHMVDDIDVTGLECNDYPSFKCTGTIAIDIAGKGWMDATGEHGARDYEDMYGFVLTIEEA